MSLRQSATIDCGGFRGAVNPLFFDTSDRGGTRWLHDFVERLGATHVEIHREGNKYVVAGRLHLIACRTKREVFGRSMSEG